MNTLSVRRRPALLVLLVVYLTALALVHDVATLLLGASVIAVTVARVLMIARLAARQSLS